MDVVNATDLLGWRGIVVAVDEAATCEPYADTKVIGVIDKDSRGDYKATAKMLADRGVSLLCIQHEYGIYGGDHGDYVIDLARAATMPVVVTLHTVLPQPSEPQLRVLKELEKHASAFVVMANKAVEILTDVYGIDRSKIHFIPHGAPVTPFFAEKAAKAQFGLQGRRVISTFGLISPNKGIEDAIAAMPKVVEKEPSAIYLVLGQTHPVVKRREGEWYRDSLQKMVDDLGLNDHVHFVDRYLTLQQLIDYLLATDVYVTPYYANPHQITSGTLAYAIATGKVIVSTPYLYAEELLANGRGFLYPFRDVDALAETVGRLLTDDAHFEETRRKAYAYGRSMTWPNVGLKYARLFTDLLDERWIHDGTIRDTLSIIGLSEVETAEHAWSTAAFN
jgi:glycosyltransferase involved in cell wall biosynthesis